MVRINGGYEASDGQWAYGSGHRKSQDRHANTYGGGRLVIELNKEEAAELGALLTAVSES